MMLKAVVLCGNPKPRSRTLALAEALAAALLPGISIVTIDLAAHADSIFAWPSNDMDELSAVVAGADVVIVASPTYKAAYTGLLKGFLDRYGPAALDGVVAIPVMTGASLAHAMAPEAHLRPLLVELGASVPTRALYFVTDNMDEVDRSVEAWVTTNARYLQATLGRDTGRHPSGA